MRAGHSDQAATRRTACALALGGLTLWLVGCAGITPKRMIPAEAAASPERKIAQRVRVLPVTGSRETFFGGPAFPTPEQIHEAVVATLDRTALFAGVSASPGDLDLTVTVLSTDQQGILPTTVRVVVNYKFTRSDGALLWSETYDSSFSAAELGGATRTVNANEGAVRENLKALVQGLRTRWPS
jgi:hypothetical protein